MASIVTVPTPRENVELEVSICDRLLISGYLETANCFLNYC